jgi:hypothetical protein
MNPQHEQQIRIWLTHARPDTWRFRAIEALLDEVDRLRRRRGDGGTGTKGLSCAGARESASLRPQQELQA